MSHSGDLLSIYQVLLDSEIVDYARRYHWRLFLLENFEPERKMKHLGSWIPISSSSLGLSWYHLVRLQRKPGLPAWRTVLHLEYIGNTDCLHHLRKVWPLLMCCAWLFLRLVQTYKRQIDQYSKLSIFCSSVSDLVFLRATPLSHLGPWQLWKILCRRFRTRSNDSRIECSIGSADECGCSQKPCVFISLFFRRQVPRVPDRICFEWQVFRFEWFW